MMVGGLMETSATTTLPGSMSNNVETASERSRGTLTSNLQSTHVGKRRNSNVSLVNSSAHINEGTEVSMDGEVCVIVRACFPCGMVRPQSNKEEAR